MLKCDVFMVKVYTFIAFLIYSTDLSREDIYRLVDKTLQSAGQESVSKQ